MIVRFGKDQIVSPLWKLVENPSDPNFDYK